MNKRIKTGDVDPRVARQLETILGREGIVSQQKCSMYLQMQEYKRMSREVAERNEELSRENVMLADAAEGRNKENADNSCRESRMVLLSREVVRLTGVVCELEKRLARREFFKDREPSGAEDRGCVDAARETVDDGMYRRIVEETAGLKARLAVISSECRQEVGEKQLEIDRLANEIHACNAELQEMKERCKGMDAEIRGWRRKEEERVRSRLDTNTRIAELERRMQTLADDLRLKESRVAHLTCEKEELDRVLEGYRSCRDRDLPGENADESLLEEEIGNLVESLDKSLSENKLLVRRLEEEHGRNERLEAEAAGLRSCSGEAALQSARLEEELRDMKREIKKCLDGDAEDGAARIRRLEEAVEESSRSAGEYRKRLYKLSMEKDAVDKALESSKRQSREMRDEVSRAVKRTCEVEMENRKISEAIRTLQGGSDVLVELEKYRSLLRCSVCDSRFKDTAITKCMHCFCKECVNVRIRMRDRRCPSCSEPFSPGDVKKIFL